MKSFIQSFSALSVLAILTVAGFATPKAHAEIWQEAQVLNNAQWSLGVFPQAGFTNSDFQLFLNGQRGFGNRWQAELRAGFGSGEALVGGLLKHHFFMSDVFQIAVIFGAHYQSAFALDGGLIFSHAFKEFAFYFAPKAQLTLGDGGSLFSIGLVPGLSARVSHNIRAYGELILNLSNYFNGVSGGLRFYL